MTGSHEVRGSIPLGSTNHFFIVNSNRVHGGDGDLDDKKLWPH